MANRRRSREKCRRRLSKVIRRRRLGERGACDAAKGECVTNGCGRADVRVRRGAGVARLERRCVRQERRRRRSSIYYNSSLISLLLEEILPALLLAPRLLARLLTLTLSAESSDELTPREGGFARRRSLLRLLQFHVTRF